MTAEEAFDLHHVAIFRYLYRMTRNADVAEDLLQECFVELIRFPGRFDAQRGTMKNYLFAIARNLALHHERDAKGWEELDEMSEEPVLADNSSRSWSVSYAVEQAVSQLPQLQREALVLFQYEGFTLEEIAVLSDVGVGTIKSRLFRARESLKRTLAPYQGRLSHERR